MLLDGTILFFLIGRHLFLQCFKFGKGMYIICNKIRVRMEGGPYSMGGGGPYSMGRILWNMDPRVHIQWGSIFNLTPVSLTVIEWTEDETRS